MKKKNVRILNLILIFIVSFSTIFLSLGNSKVKAKNIKEVKIYVVTNDDVLWGFEPNNLLDFDNYEKKILFLPVLLAKKAFKEKGALVTVDSMDKDNLVLIVSKGTTEIRFPQNKNIAIINGKTLTLSENNLYIGDNTKIDVEKWYLSPEAIDLLE
ncbi:hypothetical protein GCM10008905_28810 [Clostridium malenominatum]|uniref:Uncharacterized protein n=1 Tax=Clostridium malenominatum TaxID=1539 RepID=A0ABN1J588_9CLOT